MFNFVEMYFSLAIGKWMVSCAQDFRKDVPLIGIITDYTNKRIAVIGNTTILVFVSQTFRPSKARPFFR